MNVDSPTPYSLDVLRDNVNSQRPPGKDKKEQEPFNSVINKLEVLRRDSRMKFMMDEWNGATDPFGTIVSQFLGDGDPVTYS